MKNYVILAALLQIVMVVTGHFNEFVLLNLSAALGVGIPLVVAFFHGRGVDSAKSGARGGVVIGFVGAALGIGLAILLGDQTLALLGLGPPSSAVTGAIGGALGAVTGGGGRQPAGSS
ncbi:MAG: hypothetical protein ACR2QM_11435 [Longimicrobiales bacterium]